ncbi:MAG: hypothetical protein A2W27_07245 [Deltaproteobacteria bacterium RBG_16_44_11]|jgi:Tfp pilus assembly protein PilF|nr:MAG: hypothetical protein A2W27_07245 [Deltaproteobacteria bacterium RBG_16_44_11]
MRLGKVDEAAKHFREAIKPEPEYVNAHFQLAKILKKKELDQEATFHYQEAISINPEFKDKK